MFPTCYICKLQCILDWISQLSFLFTRKNFNHMLHRLTIMLFDMFIKFFFYSCTSVQLVIHSVVINHAFLNTVVCFRHIPSSSYIVCCITTHPTLAERNVPPSLSDRTKTSTSYTTQHLFVTFAFHLTEADTQRHKIVKRSNYLLCSCSSLIQQRTVKMYCWCV